MSLHAKIEALEAERWLHRARERACYGVLRRSLFAVLETFLRAIVPLAILPFVDIAPGFE